MNTVGSNVLFPFREVFFFFHIFFTSLMATNFNYLIFGYTEFAQISKEEVPKRESGVSPKTAVLTTLCALLRRTHETFFHILGIFS